MQGQATTTAGVQSTGIGRYTTFEDNIVAHLRSDYCAIQEGTGDNRAEIPTATFGGRQMAPDTAVRIMVEIDAGRAGRYIWVKSLQPLLAIFTGQSAARSGARKAGGVTT